jgi:REP element-mobilizing transposase RayT
MKSYYVESYHSWFVLDCQNRREAIIEGNLEYGRRNLKVVRQATVVEIKIFKAIKGDDATKF